MFTRLQRRAHAAGLVFGVKLSNTLPTDVNRGELPAAEMYLSGRALLPLTLTLAATLSRAFDGRLPLSYAGGADATNVADLVRAGIQPVTVCTTLLKPGGYARLRQLAELSTAVMTDHDRVDVDAVDALVARVTADPRTHKRHREKVGSRKTRLSLPLTDCFTAPCEHGGCPIEQQVPTYLALAAAGRQHGRLSGHRARQHRPDDHRGALLRALPAALHAARLRRRASTSAGRSWRPPTPPRTTSSPTMAPSPRRSTGAWRWSVPARPGSPPRCSCAATASPSTSSRGWTAPTASCGGSSPTFRITREQVERDYRLAVATGVSFHFGCDPDYDLADLRSRFDHVVLATGAWGRGVTPRRQRGDRSSVTRSTSSGRPRPRASGREPAAGSPSSVPATWPWTARAPRCAPTASSTSRSSTGAPSRSCRPPRRTSTPCAPRASRCSSCSPRSPTTVRCCGASAPSSATGRTTADARPAAPGPSSTSPFDTVIGATGATVDAERYRANGVARRRARAAAALARLPRGGRRRGHRGVRRRRRSPGPGHRRARHRRRQDRGPGDPAPSRHPPGLRPLCGTGVHRPRPAGRTSWPARRPGRRAGRGRALPALRRGLRDLRRGVPEPRQRRGRRAGLHRRAAGRAPRRAVQRVRQLRHLLPPRRPALPRQADGLLVARRLRRLAQRRLPAAR